jgi:hypothetical protein
VAGLASPDVPAYVCYAIVFLFGVIVAWSTVDKLLDGYPDHWAFSSTWALFCAHAALPIALFWFLDYVSALHDTSIFAALLVSVGYRQIFAGGVQGVTMPGQAATLWKPFEAWVSAVADRIGTKQKLYLDRFDEKVRSLIFGDPQRMASLETLVLSNSRDVPALQAALTGLPGTGNPDADRRRRLDTLWRDLRTSQPRDYGWLLYKRGIVRLWRYWMWLSNGRAKLISAAGIVVGLSTLVGLYSWSSSNAGGLAQRQAGLIRYHQWRFLKANGTDRDQWRSLEFLSEQLRQQGAESASAGRVPSVQDLLSPLVKELRFPSVGDRQARSILALVVNGHTATVNSYVVPELIESLRTASESVRLQIRNALLAIQKADYPNAKPADSLSKWEPKKDESPGDIDERVRAWRTWWRTAAGSQKGMAPITRAGRFSWGEVAAPHSWPASRVDGASSYQLVGFVTGGRPLRLGSREGTVVVS